jgi:hypothetical protein
MSVIACSNLWNFNLYCIEMVIKRLKFWLCLEFSVFFFIYNFFSIFLCEYFQHFFQACPTVTLFHFAKFMDHLEKWPFLTCSFKVSKNLVLKTFWHFRTSSFKHIIKLFIAPHEVEFYNAPIRLLILIKQSNSFIQIFKSNWQPFSDINIIFCFT